MTDSNRLVDRYLADLQTALAVLPPATASDIQTGIAEELHGLSPGEAQERIGQLGDPRRIAAAAGSQLRLDERASMPRSSTAYIVIAGLAVGLGGALLAGVGWAVGVVMVWISPTWKRWEKWGAVAIPLVVGAIAAAVTAAVAAPQATGPVGVLAVAASTGVVAALVVNVVVGGWLLVSGIRREKL